MRSLCKSSGADLSTEYSTCRQTSSSGVTLLAFKAVALLGWLLFFIIMANLHLPYLQTSLLTVTHVSASRQNRSMLSLSSHPGSLELSETLLEKPKYSPTVYSWKGANDQALSHGILSRRMLSARRNHDCLVKRNPLTGHLNLWLIGGRYAQNIETIDLVTGEQKYRTEQDEPMLDASHYNLVLVKNLKTNQEEIWIPCGFEGHGVDKERSLKNMRIIELGFNDSVTSIRKGPAQDRPRGGCAALAFDVEGPSKPVQICLFGGSDGSHDRGVFLNTISCYDRERKVFTHPFGELPIAGDHHNIIHVPPGRCNNTLPEMLLYLNFRGKPYAAESKEIYAKNISRDADGRVLPKGEWFLFLNDSKAQPWDAGGLVFGPSGRYLYNFGGTHHILVGRHKRRKGLATNKVRALDLCTPKWIFNVATLDSKRFALTSCKTEDFAFTCGGDMSCAYGALENPQRTDTEYGDKHNGRECEVHRLDDLEREAERLSKLT